MTICHKHLTGLKLYCHIHSIHDFTWVITEDIGEGNTKNIHKPNNLLWITKLYKLSIGSATRRLIYRLIINQHIQHREGYIKLSWQNKKSVKFS